MNGTGVTLPWTIAYVGRVWDTTMAARMVAAYDAASVNLLIGFYSTYMDIGYDNGFFGNGINATTEWRMYSGDCPAFGSTRMFKDGVELTPLPSGGGGWGGMLFISGYTPGGAGGESGNVEVAEVVMYNRKLSDLERQQVEGYLRSKWLVVPSQTVPVRGVYPPGFVPTIVDTFVVDDGHVADGTVAQFGTVAIKTVVVTPVGGVFSAQAFGVLILGTVARLTGGVGSAQSFGSLRFKTTAVVAGLTSGQAFGAIRIVVPQFVQVPGLAPFGFVSSITGLVISGDGHVVFGAPVGQFGAIGISTGPISVAIKGLSPGAVSPYAQAVLTDAPVLYWRLNESSGTVAADASGRGRDGTVVGSLQRGVPSPIGDGTAVRATATGQRVTAPTFPAAEATPFSYEFWWKPNAAGLSTYNSPVLKSTSDAWNDGFGCYWMTPNHALFFWIKDYTRSTWLEPVSPGPWPDWVHIAFTYDGNTQRAYLNGVYVPNGANVIGSFSVATTGDLSLAGSVTGTYEAPGDYDEFAFYDHVLTPAQIAAHFAAAGGAAGASQFGVPIFLRIQPVLGVGSAQLFGTIGLKFLVFGVPSSALIGDHDIAVYNVWLHDSHCIDEEATAPVERQFELVAAGTATSELEESESRCL